MTYRVLTKEECDKHKVGEGVTLATVMCIAAIAVMAVVVYRLFMSGKGSAAIPGGWKFTWNQTLSKIKSLPILERPREKAYRYGIDKLSDHELIAILIGTGTIDHSALDIAYKLLMENKGLFHLVQKPFSDLLSVKGIGKSKAVKIIAAFEIAKRFNSLKANEDEFVSSPDKIYEKYKYLIANSVQEFLILIVLSSNKKVLHEVNLYKGNEDSLNCSWRQIIQQVLIHNGKYFYIVHNHPSGNHCPSEEDINFTTTLIKESQKLKIKLLDHLIISRNGYFSFLKQNEK